MSETIKMMEMIKYSFVIWRSDLFNIM